MLSQAHRSAIFLLLFCLIASSLAPAPNGPTSTKRASRSRSSSQSHSQYVEQLPMGSEETPVRALCPPPELLRPCKCEERFNGLIGQTLFACNGTEIKSGQRNAGLEQTLHRISKRLAANGRKQFDWMYLTNFEEMRKITRNFFAGLRFRNLVIENAPRLQSIHPGAFKLVNDKLKYVYLYNTGLEHYRRSPMVAPFGALKNLTEMHIASKSNICPPKEIISPCECNIRQNPLLPFEIPRQILQLRCIGTRTAGYNVSRIFNRLTELGHNTNRSIWYFDEVILRNVSELGPHSFGDVDFAELQIEDSADLQYISSDAFPENCTLQKLRISGTNFVADKLGQTFEALNGLPYLRSLFIWSANFEFVPEYAFSRAQPFLKEIVLYGNNIRAIGSYAFQSLASIEHLRVDGNNIVLLDRYALATNYSSSVPLQVTLVSNNFRENSFAFMALAGAQRPLHISLAEIGGCFWDLSYLDEAVFAPFLDKSANRLYLEPECELKCDHCQMRWLVEMPKHAQRRVTLLPDSPYRENGTAAVLATGYVPCEGGANLFDIFEFLDWEHCN